MKVSSLGLPPLVEVAKVGLRLIGHGDQVPDDNGDEKDGKLALSIPRDSGLTHLGLDEVIIPVDYAIMQVNGIYKIDPRSVVIDDLMNDIL